MRRLAITVLAAAVIAAPAAAPAQPAPQGKVGPTAMLIRALCLPWLSGADAAAMTAAAQKNGFKPKYIGDVLTGIDAPEALQSRGWFGVRFSDDRNWCEIDLAWRGPSRIDAVTAEIEAFAPLAPPQWRFAKATPVRDPWGYLPDRAWASPSGRLWLRERGNDLLPQIGQPDPLVMTVHVQKN